MIENVLRIGFSLVVVMGLMWILARAVRRPLGVGRPHGPVAVLNRQQLTRSAAVTVVRVADRALVLGVTDHQVSLLGEVEAAAFERGPAQRRDIMSLTAADLPAAHPAARAHTSPLAFLRDRTRTSPLDLQRDRTRTSPLDLPRDRARTSPLDFLRERTLRR